VKKISNSFYRVLLLSFLAVGLLMYLGCSPKKTLNVQWRQSENDSLISSEEIEILSEISDSIYETQQDSVCIIEMFTEVQRFIADSTFNSADSVLREILQLTGNISESDLPSISEHFERVLNIYIEQIPSELIKEDIAILIFQHQMFESLDSSQYSLDDSSDLELFHCRKNVTYDIPVVWNDRVKRALHYYLKNRNSTINNWLSRANMYLPVFKKMFADSGLPLDLAYLPLIESAFNPKAYSRAHASGIWQFIPSTGKVYGLRQNYWMDERRDPIKSTAAAISYLKKLYNDFNDWHLALAAYNCGEGRVSRTINRCDSQNYWELTLPKETMNYVPLYLASLIIAKNPQCFGYTGMKTDTLLLDTVSISECLDIAEIAKGINLDQEKLKKLNPHILHWCTPPDISEVNFYLPSGKTDDFISFYSSFPDEKKVKWYRYKIRRGDNLISIARSFKLPVSAIKSVNRLSGNRIVAGKHLFIPIPVNSSFPVQKETITEKFKTADPVEKKGERIRYKVKDGDTVWRLSDIFNVTSKQIYSWNNLKDARIKVGQILDIYQDSSKSGTYFPDQKSKQPNFLQEDNLRNGYHQYKVVSGDTPISIARKFSMDVNDLIEINRLDKNKPVVYTGDIIQVKNTMPNPEKVVSQVKATEYSKTIRYLVAPGDNLFRISKNFSVSLNEILTLNNMTENSIIKPGDTLLIPYSGKAAENYNQTVPDINSIVYYEIKQGDNLWNIASIFGVPVNKLYDLNNLNPGSILMPGDTIKVIRTGQM